MKKEEILYLNLILFHVGIGFLVFVFPFFSKIYGYAIFIVGTFYIIKKQNKNHQRMTKNHPAPRPPPSPPRQK